MGCLPLADLCPPLADLHHFCLTKRFPKTPSAAPFNPLERHLHFALIRLFLALLFIISIPHVLGGTELVRTYLQLPLQKWGAGNVYLLWALVLSS